MHLKQLLYIILIITLRKNIQCYATNKTGVGNKTTRDDDFTSGFFLKEKYSNKTKSKQRILGFGNSSNAVEYKTKSNIIQQQQTNFAKTLVRRDVDAIAGQQDLHSLPLHDVIGISNCSYENTIKINITKDALLANGSYIYDNQTLIPAQLVGNYDYEILYNGTRRKVPQHKRACICHLKPCITLCSNDILEAYQYVIEEAMTDSLSIFWIEMKLSNKSVVTKNIATDFQPIVLSEYCESAYMLSPEISENSDWTLFENGSLLRHIDQKQLKRTEYCFDLHVTHDGYNLVNPKLCSKEKEGLTTLEKINYCVQVISIMLLLFTIIAYCSLSKLLDVHGKCFLTYVCCLTLSFCIFSFINLSQIHFNPVPCLLMGYLNHYLQLSHYTWLGIICFDTWKTVKDLDYISSYATYAKFGYPLPSVMTIITAVAQYVNIPESLKPGISEYRCGLDVTKWAASIYLFGPCLIILICCLISFILTSKSIKIQKREISELQQATITSHETRNSFYFRLFLMMGLSWFFDVLSYLFYVLDLKMPSVVLDYVNTMQGFYIFANYILRRKVRNMMIIKIRRIKRLREAN